MEPTPLTRQTAARIVENMREQRTPRGVRLAERALAEPSTSAYRAPRSAARCACCTRRDSECREAGRLHGAPYRGAAG